MNAKNSLSMSRKLLLLVGAVLCALPLSAQEVWREGRNMAVGDTVHLCMSDERRFSENTYFCITQKCHL